MKITEPVSRQALSRLSWVLASFSSLSKQPKLSQLLIMASRPTTASRQSGFSMRRGIRCIWFAPRFAGRKRALYSTRYNTGAYENVLAFLEACAERISRGRYIEQCECTHQGDAARRRDPSDSRQGSRSWDSHRGPFLAWYTQRSSTHPRSLGYRQHYLITQKGLLTW